MSTVYDQIMSLRSVRQYSNKPLSEEHLDQILESARWTGSAKNLQLWSFIVVDGAQKERLCAAGDFTTPLANAPVAIALVQEPHGYEFDTGRLAQNIMLAAASLGVVSCPITLHRDEVAAEVLELPEGARARYAVSLGYPPEDGKIARFGGQGGRKDRAEVIFHNTHGAPLDDS
jgi:nitroreductase